MDHQQFFPADENLTAAFGDSFNDIDMLKYATRTLYDELAIALKVPRDKVEDKIFSMMKGY